MKKNFFDPEVEVVELNSKPMKRLEGTDPSMSGGVVVRPGIPTTVPKGE